MRRLITILTNVRLRSTDRRAGIFTTLLLTGVLFGALQAQALCQTEEVYLGSFSSGYVNVTSYLQTDQYGNVWVVGYDGEPSFEIVIEASQGQVLDPYGNQIGICFSEV